KRLREPRSQSEDVRVRRQSCCWSGGLNVLKPRSAPLSERSISQEHLSTRLPECLRHDLARAARPHDSGTRLVQREGNASEIEDGVVSRDIFNFDDLERNTELLPEFLISIGEGFRLRSKNQVAGIEEQAHLHFTA